MNNKLTFPGGEPLMNEDDFLRIQQANRLALFGMAKAFNEGGDIIISGCGVIPNGPNINITTGYILLDGEVLQVDPQTNVPDTEGNGFYRYEKQTTFEAGGDKTFLDSTPRQTWEKNRGVAVSVTAIQAGDLSVKDGLRFNDLIQNIIDINNDGVITEVLNIGNWDMDNDVGIQVPFTVPVGFVIVDYTAIVFVGTADPLNFGQVYKLEWIDTANPSDYTIDGQIDKVSTTYFQLRRRTGGFFDQASFGGSVTNRGFVTVRYKPE